LRGADGARLGLGNLENEQGGVVPVPADPPPGFTSVIRLPKDKVNQSVCSSSFALQAPAERHYESFVVRLGKFLELSRSLGYPIAGYVLRPLCHADHSIFSDHHLSGSSVNDRLVTHLTSAGLYACESAHSHRRGSLQHHEDEGMHFEDLSAQGHISTPEVLCRYLDRRRGVLRAELRVRQGACP
jgi:hypothetical protein